MSTPYMGLDLPVPTVTAGPLYASQNNAAFTVIDAHDHTAGKGVPVPVSGLNINADLPFGAFNAINMRSARFASQSAPLSDPTDLNCLYSSAGNLYFNDGLGQQVQITAGGGINAASVGGIGGDYATSSASLFYTTATTKYTFWQNSNVAAFIDAGAITIRDTGASANGITLQAPVGLAGSYSLTFPAALPGATRILTLDISGNIGATYDVDNTTLAIVTDAIGVKDLGIGTLQLAAGAVTPAKMSAMNYTAGSNFSFSTSSGSYVDVTGASCTITTVGRPVEVTMQSGSAASLTYLQATVAGNPSAGLYYQILRGATVIAQYEANVITNASGAAGQWAPGGFRFIDFNAPAGTHTYKVQTRAVGSSVSVNYVNCQLVVLEMV